MQRRDWTKALQVVAKSNDPKLFYLHAPTLMQHAPVGTTNALINASRSPTFQLDPTQLLPALMCYEAANSAASASPGKAGAAAAAPVGAGAVAGAGAGAGAGGAQGMVTQANQALRFLLHCVKNLRLTDAVMMKMLIALLAKHQDDKAMVAFLSDCSASGLDAALDLHFCYRTCQAAGKKEACIMVLSLMHQYSEAVDLALEIEDVALAKINADHMTDDPEVRKRLWLKIAKFVIEQTGDVKAAMALITDTERSCPLKVEDILPLFPDFAVMDDLKEAICESLADYQRHIEGLKRGMQDATKTSGVVLLDLPVLVGLFYV
jgi:hypothetical protein